MGPGYGFCGTLYVLGHMVDVYEHQNGVLKAFNGSETVTLRGTDLEYLISMGTVLDWRLRERYVAKSGRVLYF